MTARAAETARAQRVAAERTRIAERVVAQLLAQMRGDGQRSLDLWGQVPDA